MRLGVLTGGGDCPGLNAAIRAVVRRAEIDDVTCVGFRHGWKDVIAGVAVDLDVASTRGLLQRGGTFLGTSRVDPYREEHGVERIKDALVTHALDGFVVIGGEGTLSASRRLTEDEGVPIVGIPKTIDNDVAGTDVTIGFATAVDIATEAVDRLHSTAESHDRVMVLEVMGRHAGWIATLAGLAGGADAILVPERPFDIDAVCQHLRARAGSGRDFSIVVVAEGALPEPGTLELPAQAMDEFGRPRLGGIGQVIAHEVEARTGFPSRITVLGHVQRGGTPSPADRVLASRFGVHAVQMALKGDWGRMTAVQGSEVTSVGLDEATAELKLVPPALHDVASTFFG